MDDQGCWVAYYGDWSSIVIFDNEVEALRHAVGSSMMVCFVRYGQDLVNDEVRHL